MRFAIAFSLLVSSVAIADPVESRLHAGAHEYACRGEGANIAVILEEAQVGEKPCLRVRFKDEAGEPRGPGHFVWGCEAKKDPTGSLRYDFLIADLPGSLVVTNGLAQLRKNQHVYSCHDVSASPQISMNEVREERQERRDIPNGHHER